MIVAAKPAYTPEDLLTMPDGDRYELVDGNLVERNMSARSSRVGGQLYFRLENACRTKSTGWVWPADASYKCFLDSPNTVRKPDVSFIQLSRLRPEDELEGHILIAPDLAVEVSSPNDLVYEISAKVQEYLRAGVKLVWVINPENRTVQIFRADGTVAMLRESDELNGEDVIPGFRCPIADLFLTPYDIPPAS
jgi:Uma2 family endonuclease